MFFVLSEQVSTFVKIPLGGGGGVTTMVAKKGLEKAIAYLNPSKGHKGNPSHQLWVRVECTLHVYLLVQLIPLAEGSNFKFDF